MKKRIAISVLLSVAVLLLSYIAGNSARPLAGEKSVLVKLNSWKTMLGLAHDSVPDDVLLVNVAYDKMLVDYTEDGLPIGQETITDRRKLLEFLTKAREADNYKFIMMDVILEQGITTEYDSALFHAIAQMPRIVIPVHADAPLQEKQLSAILWAANGINRPESGKRVNPTTKGVYNIDVYAVMAGGIYKYDPAAHALTQVSPVDFRPQINEKQTFVHTAPLTLFYVSNPVPPRDPSRPVNKERQHENNCLVAGTMLQSVALVAVDEGLGTCVRGSIDKDAFAKAAGLAPEQTVLISQTIGVLP